MPGTAGFPARLRYARIHAGIDGPNEPKKADLARHLGITPQAYGPYETGKSPPTLKAVEALAEYLGVSPGWLAFGDGPDPATISGASAAAGEVGGAGGTGRRGE